MLKRIIDCFGKHCTKRGIKLSAFVLTFCIVAMTAIMTGSAADDRILINDGEATYSIDTYSNETSEILKEAGIELGINDTCTVSNNNGVTTYTITRESGEFNETVIVNDVPLRLGSFDVVPTNMEIIEKEQEKKVEYEYVTVTKKISYKKIEEKTSDLYVGETKIKQKGVEGSKKITYLKEIVDGETVASSVYSEEVVKEAVNQITLVGTRYYSNNATQTNEDVNCISTLKPADPIELDENGIPCSYKEIMKGKATAYCCGTTCATGVKVQPGYIAVNPKIIPYGTKMYIVSDDGRYIYGYAVAADTGGFAKKNALIADLYFPTVEECIQFGRRNITIYILD